VRDIVYVIFGIINLFIGATAPTVRLLACLLARFSGMGQGHG
jgi:hypothetical protein